MTFSLRQLGILLAVGVVAMITRTVDAGFVSLADDSVLHAYSVFEPAPSANSPRMVSAKAPSSDFTAPWRWPIHHRKIPAQMAGPIGWGGLTSSGGVSDAPQSLAMNSTPDDPPPGLVRRFAILEQVLVPRVAISGIFRPPWIRRQSGVVPAGESSVRVANGSFGGEICRYFFEESFMLKSLKVLSLCAITLPSLYSEAEGGFSLQVTDVSTATVVTVNDNGAGDLTADTNKILISQDVGSFEVFATSGITNTPGTSFAELINGVGSITNLTPEARSLTLILSASDFTLPVGDLLLGIIASTGQFQNVEGTADLLVSFYYDGGNALFAQTTLITSADYSIAGTQGNLTVNESGTLLGAAAPYSLTLRIDIELSGDAKIDVDSTALLTSAVPEPTSMAILGLGGLLAGFGVTRRKRKQAAELTV